MNLFWLSAEHKVRPDLPNWTSDSLQEKQDGIWHQLLHCTRLTLHPTAAVTSAVATLYWQLSACDNWAMVVAACSGQTDGVIWCRCSGVLNTHSSPTRRKYCRHTYTHTQCIRYIHRAYYYITECTCNCLQCFDAVGWAAGRASGL